jgi:hypothetical protein
MDVNLLSLNTNLRLVVERDLWRFRRGAHIGEIGESTQFVMTSSKRIKYRDPRRLNRSEMLAVHTLCIWQW